MFTFLHAAAADLCLHKAALLNLYLWVATPAGVDWWFSRGRPSEVCKQNCHRMKFWCKWLKKVIQKFGPSKCFSRYAPVGWGVAVSLEMSSKVAAIYRGLHPHWGNDAFPPVSDFPLFPKIFQTPWFSQFHLPPQNFRFSSAKISDDLFILLKISNFPLFSLL